MQVYIPAADLSISQDIQTNVTVTHKPSGISVCQERQRSFHQTKMKAVEKLQACLKATGWLSSFVEDERYLRAQREIEKAAAHQAVLALELQKFTAGSMALTPERCAAFKVKLEELRAAQDTLYVGLGLFVSSYAEPEE